MHSEFIHFFHYSHWSTFLRLHCDYPKQAQTIYVWTAAVASWVVCSLSSIHYAQNKIFFPKRKDGIIPFQILQCFHTAPLGKTPDRRYEVQPPCRSPILRFCSVSGS